jgi:L-malate glycosyltransferase
MTKTKSESGTLRLAILSEFVHPFHSGGAERRYYELARRLADRGHEVHWYAMKDWPGANSITFEGIHLHAAHEPVDVYAEGGGRAIGPGLRIGLALTNALRRSRHTFDLVDCSLYPFFHIFGARIVRPRIPIVVTWYEYWGDHWYEYLGWKGFFGKQVERAASSLPKQIISVSDATTDALTRGGVPRARITTVPLGVDTAQIARIAPDPRRSDLVFFGRLKNHKNVDALLCAFALLHRSRPELICAIVGDGPERARLEQLARDLNIHGSVRFHGSVSDDEVIGLIKASRLFVHPSTKEGGGSITLMEANASGLPVVAVAHPLGIDRSLIEEGRTGWWADSATPDRLAAKIDEILSDEHALESAGHAAHEFARSYDWNRITDECEAIYLEVARNE